MNNLYSNIYPIINLHKDPSSKSEIVTQMIYGEGFRIIRKTLKWIKIKIKEDGYVGFIKKKKFVSYIKPTHKISILSADIYSKPNYLHKVGKLSYASKIKVEKTKHNFSMFLIGFTPKIQKNR